MMIEITAGIDVEHGAHNKINIDLLIIPFHCFLWPCFHDAVLLDGHILHVLEITNESTYLGRTIRHKLTIDSYLLNIGSESIHLTMTVLQCVCGSFHQDLFEWKDVGCFTHWVTQQLPQDVSARTNKWVKFDVKLPK